jgi:hypothetical protein
MADRPEGTDATTRRHGTRPSRHAAPERREPGGIGELRRAQPVDATTRNLLTVINSKLELSSHLPVFEWEAAKDGHDRCAETFRALLDTERHVCAELLECLQTHLHTPSRSKA